MNVEIWTSDDYVKVRQTSPMDNPTNLSAEQARELAEDLMELVDKVEE